MNFEINKEEVICLLKGLIKKDRKKDVSLDMCKKGYASKKTNLGFPDYSINAIYLNEIELDELIKIYLKYKEEPMGTPTEWNKTPGKAIGINI